MDDLMLFSPNDWLIVTVLSLLSTPLMFVFTLVITGGKPW